MNEYKITVIVPMYNVESYIEETIDSITSQTMFEEVELLIVDDCSTDRSLKIAQTKGKNHPNIRLLRQPENAGVSACRNMGMHHANGEFIFFADSDDVLPQNALERLYTAACQEEADLVTAPFCHLHDGELKEGLTKVFPELKKEGAISIQHAPSIIYSIFCWGKLYKKSMVEDLLFQEDISFGEDQIFTISAMLRAEKIYNISDITYHYRIRYSSITKTASSTKAMKSSIRVGRIVEECIEASSLVEKDMLKSYYFKSCLIRDIWGPFRLALTGVPIGERHETLSVLNDWVLEIPNHYVQEYINEFNEILKIIGEFFPGMDTKSQQTLISIFKAIKSKYGQPAVN